MTQKKMISLHPKIERKLRQIFLTDLICEQFGSLYKDHLELMLAWQKILAVEAQLPQQDQQVLRAACYGYHWGCGNLFGQPFAHQCDPVFHTRSCFTLGSSKLERFLSYHASCFLRHKQILATAEVLLDQPNSSNLAAKLHEISTIAWIELLQVPIKSMTTEYQQQTLQKLVQATMSFSPVARQAVEAVISETSD